MTWNKAWGGFSLWACGALMAQAVYQPLRLELAPAAVFGVLGIAFLRREW